MATTKSTTPRSRSTAKRRTIAKPRATTGAKADDSLIARTGRTLKERPYTSAAIATGAVTAVAAAAAGAFFFSRRDKSFKEASDELTSRVKEGLANASETVKGSFASASGTIKDLGQRGSNYVKGDDATRSQQQFAEEALTLKETGSAKRPIDKLSATEIKSGTVAY